MRRRSEWVKASALPLALIGIAFALFWAALPDDLGRRAWLGAGVMALAASVGVVMGWRWSYVVEGFVGLATAALFLFFAWFSIGMMLGDGAGPDRGMLGTPWGILNGYESLAVFAAFLLASVWSIVASWLGLHDARGRTSRDRQRR
ncbi:MAG TPA: hypothetical protein VEY67_05605 [Candidatus Dormibacteraeota bacterium]|nr:hypothetical protein [Candidatus Dormibacteraeota bacterium]